MSERKQVDFNEVIGITEEGEVVLLNYIFSYPNKDGTLFCGATGASLVPITQDYIDSRNDPDELIANGYDYLWKEAVACGSTEESLRDYMQEMIDYEVNYGDGLYFGHDTSYTYHVSEEFLEQHFPGAVGLECIGGGRMFDAEKETKWKVLLRPDLLKRVMLAEAGTPDI